MSGQPRLPMRSDQGESMTTTSPRKLRRIVTDYDRDTKAKPLGIGHPRT